MQFDETKFRETVMRALRIPADSYRPDLQIGDLEQWDSVAHLELISELETTFDAQFSLDDMAELTSLESLRARLGG
jgi:acyl carrier protein